MEQPSELHVNRMGDASLKHWKEFLIIQTNLRFDAIIEIFWVDQNWTKYNSKFIRNWIRIRKKNPDETIYFYLEIIWFHHISRNRRSQNNFLLCYSLLGSSISSFLLFQTLYNRPLRGLLLLFCLLHVSCKPRDMRQTAFSERS